MITEIYIDNQLVDLYNNEDIVLSFSVNNIFELEAKTGTYSNTFNIPATNRNNIIFDNLNNVLSTSNKYFKSLPCLIYANGLLVIQGYADLVSASKLEYTVQVYAGNTTWFNAISDVKLSELLLGCEYTQYYNIATVIGSRSNIWTDVFIYPNIDYGELFFLPGNPPYNVEWFKLYPAVYAKYLFKKAFDLAGLTISSEWFDNNILFEKQIIPFSADFKRSLEYNLRDHFIYTLGTDATNNNAGFIPINVHTNIGHILDSSCFNFRLGDTFSTPSTPYFLNPIRQIAETFCTLDGGVVTIDYNITYETDTLVSPAATTTQILIDYIDANGNTQLFNIIPVVSGIQPITNVTGSFTLNIGRGGIRVNLQQCKIYAGSTLEFTIDPSGADDGDLQINFPYNFITLGGTLPDITVTDFILTIANQYGLIFQQNDFSNEVQIFQFNKVINGIGAALDYSNKLDLSEDPVITFLDERYVRNNYFNYAPDDTDEYLTRLNGYGNGSIEIINSPAGTEQIIFESVLSPVIRLLSFNGGGTPLELAYIPSNEGSVFTIVNGRTAYIEQDSTSLLTIDPGGFLAPVQPNVYFKDLEFNNLLSVYYQNITDLLNSSRSVKVLLRLNNLDINKLDFSKPIYIEYFGAYFYINEIQQYKVTSVDSTEVELILISN